MVNFEEFDDWMNETAHMGPGIYVAVLPPSLDVLPSIKPTMQELPDVDIRYATYTYAAAVRATQDSAAKPHCPGKPYTDFDLMFLDRVGKHKNYTLDYVENIVTRRKPNSYLYVFCNAFDISMIKYLKPISQGILNLTMAHV